MMKYEYVKLNLEVPFVGSKSTEHTNIIDSYAKKGYRYVGYIPTNISDLGRIREIDLIFEIQH